MFSRTQSFLFSFTSQSPSLSDIFFSFLLSYSKQSPSVTPNFHSFLVMYYTISSCFIILLPWTSSNAMDVLYKNCETYVNLIRLYDQQVQWDPWKHHVLCDIFNFLRNAAAIYRHSSGGLSFSLPLPDIFKNYVSYCLKNISMIFDFLPKKLLVYLQFLVIMLLLAPCFSCTVGLKKYKTIGL